MTVSTTTNREQYATNGVTTAFTIHFPFFADTDVNAIFVTSGGVSTTFALNTDFTVSGGAVDGGVPAGGTLTCAVAPATGGTLTIYRNVPSTQESDYVEDDPLPADQLEADLDRAAIRDQQLQDGQDRALTFPVTVDPSVSAELPTPEADTYLAWNSAGDALENKTLAAGTAVYSSIANTNTGTATAEAVTPAGLAGSKYNPIGKHEFFFNPGGLQSAVTNGATATSAEETTSKHNYTGLSFTNGTQQFACGEFVMPKSSNESTITFKVDLRHASGSGNVEFALEAVGVGSGDTEDVTYGTAISVIVALTTTAQKYVSAESAALTIKNLSEGDAVKFRLKRVITTSGNIAQPVVVTKLRLYVTTNTGTDA